MSMTGINCIIGRRRAAHRPLRVGHLELAERVADLRGVRPEHLLDDRQQRPGALDRQPQLLGVGLVLGALRQAGAAPAEVDEGHERLDEHVLDADLLQLGLVGGAQLLLGGLALGRGRAHAVGTSCAYVARVSRTVAA